MGIPHAFIAGLLYGLFPQVNPIMPRYLPAPGYYMSNLGAPYIIVFIGMYLLFGLIMGITYKLDGKIAKLPIELEEDQLSSQAQFNRRERDFSNDSLPSLKA